MNEFIELEVLTESGIIYTAGNLLEKLKDVDFYSYTPDKLRRLIKESNKEFTNPRSQEGPNFNWGRNR